MDRSERSGRKEAIQEILRMISKELDGRTPKGEPKVAKLEVIKIKGKPMESDSEHEYEDEDSEDMEKSKDGWECDCEDGDCEFCRVMKEVEKEDKPE